MLEGLLNKNRSGWILLTLVFTISLLIFTTGIRRSSIYILDESKNAQCAWEMMHSGNPVVPTFNGELRTDKPALHYYAMMVGYSVWGKTPFAARVISGVMGAILMMAVAGFVARYAGRRVAFWTMIVLFSSIMWITEFHLSVPDPYLITLVGLGLMAFYHFMEGNRRWALFPGYLFLSLGFLAKGPVAILLPLVVLFIYLILTKRLTWRYVFKLQPIAGIAIFILTALPWYYLVHQATDGEWTRGFFLDHNVGRFTSTKEGHGGVFLLTTLYFLVGLLPFSAFITGAVKDAWHSKDQRLVLFCSIVVLVFVLFFSISRTMLPNYVMPCFPFAAILFGRYLNRLAVENMSIPLNVRVGLWIIFGISLLIPLALTFGTIFEPLLAGEHTLGVWLLFMPLGVWMAIRLIQQGRVERGFLTIFFTFCLGTALIHLILIPKADKLNPVQATLGMLRNAKEVRYYRTINPSYITNYGLIPKLTDTADVRTFLTNPSHLLITSQKAVNENPAYWSRFAVVYTAKDIFDNNQTVILKRRE